MPPELHQESFGTPGALLCTSKHKYRKGKEDILPQAAEASEVKGPDQAWFTEVRSHTDDDTGPGKTLTEHLQCVR